MSLNECDDWSGYRDKGGYGVRTVHGTPRRVHRLEWERFHGSIPAGMCVLHKCDNPPCKNIDHLFLGTKADNARDKVVKQRQVRLKGASNGMSRLTEADVLSIRAALVDAPRGTAARLAVYYNVDQVTISDIKHSRKWKHI